MSLSSTDLVDVVDRTIEGLHRDHRTQLIIGSDVDEDILQIRWKGEFVIHRHGRGDKELPLDTRSKDTAIELYRLLSRHLLKEKFTDILQLKRITNRIAIRRGNLDEDLTEMRACSIDLIL